MSITFNPGPSQLSESTKQDVKDAIELGIAEMSHRSSQFSEMSKKTISELRSFFGVPENYSIYYTSSATEAMDLTVRNLVDRSSCHFTCGRFSELFSDIAISYRKKTVSVSAPWGDSPVYDPSLVPEEAELISITSNETSTGVQCANDDIERIRKAHPKKILALDITSIAGMKQFIINQADIWLFSVQKGFGLPAGLGVLIVSEEALKRSKQLEEAGNNMAGTYTFSAMEKLMREKYQTISTPNSLGIFLLGRELERWNAGGGGVKVIEEETREKAAMVYEAAEKSEHFQCYVQNKDLRSISVACIEAPPEIISRMHALAKEEGIVLGKGYGKLKESTFRLGLFPAISKEDVGRVIQVMDSHQRYLKPLNCSNRTM